jgi:NAD(P)-dependent dehydrogenase (short-subunit alcohol dehydrogenase family)
MTSDLFSLEGKVALITGATRGLGLAIAEEMGRSGAHVVVSSNEPDACRAVERSLQGAGVLALGVSCDVSCREALQTLVDAALTRFGRIDVLVCNAGVAPHMGPIASASDADWDLTITVNLRSILWLTSMVIPQMADRRDGSVIIISSIAGVRGNKSIGLYGLSKAGSAELARNLAVEWGPSNVRVNAISPGLVRTDFAKPLLEDPDTLQRRVALTPLRRVGEPREIAGIAVMLASHAGTFITGHNLIVDGGTTIGDGN